MTHFRHRRPIRQRPSLGSQSVGLDVARLRPGGHRCSRSLPRPVHRRIPRISRPRRWNWWQLCSGFDQICDAALLLRMEVNFHPPLGL